MRDIVIPYKRNSSGELETCIALIKKNVPHRNIYVVEDYESTTYSEVPHINVALKLAWALGRLDLTDKFYLFNDDFFVLEPVEEVPYMHKGSLDLHIAARRGNGHYTKALKYTREWLGGGALSYEIHAPFLFDKFKLFNAMGALRPSIDSGECPLIRSWYGNCMAVGGTKVEDVKNVENYEGKTYLSTNEQSFKRDIGDYIRSKL